jgi:hypothetical protein
MAVKQWLPFWAMWVVVVLAMTFASAAETADQQALETGLVEDVRSGLIQVPVVISGTGDLYRLSRDDIEVWIGDRRLEDFHLDYLREATTVRRESAAPPRQRPRASSVASKPTRAGSFRNHCDRISAEAAIRTASLPAIRSRPARATRVSATVNRSTLSLVSIDLFDGPPPPAVRIASTSRYLSVGAAMLEIPKAPEAAAGGNAALGVTLAPVAFDDGVYEVLVQASLLTPDAGVASWDLDVTIAARSTSSLVWGRVETAGGENRLVLQDTLRLRPGHYRLTAQALNRLTGEVVRGFSSGKLPARPKARVFVGPTAVFQHDQAAILRAGRPQSSSGAILLDAEEPLAPDRERALLTTLCGNASRPADLMVDRALIGEDGMSFPTVRIEAGIDQCVLVDDRIPASATSDGNFEYRIRVFDSGTLVSERMRELVIDVPR